MTSSNLPDQIALFPLPNVVLFPRLRLPLHIFEPRYRQMVEDVRANDGLLGMTLLHPSGVAGPQGEPPIFPIGCVGRIGDFELMEDGRSNLVLEGLRRFRIRLETAGRAYRRAEVEWLGGEEGANSLEELPDNLLASVERLLQRLGRDFQGKLEDQLPGDPALVVNTLAFALDLPMVEKMALLECDEPATRAARLRELLEFHLAGDAGQGGSEPGGVLQ